MILQLVSLGTLSLLGMGWCVAGRAEPTAAPRTLVAVKASVLIRRRPHDVLAFVTNTANDTAWRTLSGAAPVNTERGVVAVEGGTLFTCSLKADVTDVLVFRALRPLIEWWYAHKLRRYVQVLKVLLEGPGAGRGAAP